jgi:acyl-CoA synthetase (AMP-forming)/AMP-acid ligase II
MFLEAGEGVALVDADQGTTWSYADLRDAVRRRTAELPGGAGLVMLAADTSVDTIIDLLSLLGSGQPVALVDPTLDVDRARSLTERYAADVVVDRRRRWALEDGYREHAPGVSVRAYGPTSSADLALLLSTSGSTGSPKLVRLSRRNLLSNAEAIGKSLHLNDSDRAATALPLHYSYGLSVLLSHLRAGAGLVVTEASILERRFWEAFEQHCCTLLNAVPYSFHLLRRTGFYDRDLPKLRAVTQAGGKLAGPDLVTAHERLSAKGVDLFVMYGQTEASPRIACLPPERLPAKFGSVGRPLDGGVIRILTEHGEASPGEVGEVVYEGPNVMLGYAECRADLARGDDQSGVLRTGDLGYLDDEGYLFLTGRMKRIAKVFGVRVNLDEVEQEVRHLAPAAALPGDDKVVIFTETADEETLRTSRAALAKSLRVAVGGVRLVSLPHLPLLPNGKVDYRALEGQLDGSHES